MSDYILGIESSCDDTSIALVDTEYRVIAMKTVSQTSVHSLFGGIIPEIAARNHIAWIFPLLRSLLDEAKISLSDLSAIAVTTHPGLVGSLLVGVGAAKGISAATGIPLVGINHLEAHIASASLNRKSRPQLPFLSLIISGGHTSLIEVKKEGIYTLGATMDDAAGEAFDKVAKMAKLGYPGGPVIDKLAQKGDASRYKMPKLLTSEKYKHSFVFSFSGLKTATQRFLKNDDIDMPSLMAAFQKSLFELVERRIIYALKHNKYKALVVVGGVSANSELRERMERVSHRFDTALFLPELQYCQDNGAMTAAAAIPAFQTKQFADFTLDAAPTKREIYG
ncbi:tRNA (adenosine(37)-N6)-threonylcarbamoyltransferase complex transferase subunit TsaD [bacterium]|nr:tRNA (adenosine(37)-N6)-threonylcarbamoyltransferase complex transferase subunit TsaD [bacterium]